MNAVQLTEDITLLLNIDDNIVKMCIDSSSAVVMRLSLIKKWAESHCYLIRDQTEKIHS